MDLEKKGWITPDFLSTLTFSQLISLLNIEKTPLNIAHLENSLIKLKKAHSQTILPSNPVKKFLWNISMGAMDLNNLFLFNGIPAGEITLLYGKFRSGKSQIAHQCCCEIYRQFKKNLPETLTLFIDTEGTFRPERISQISEALNLDTSEVMEKISTAEARSIADLKMVINKLEQAIISSGLKFVIIDSLTKVFRYEIAKGEVKIHQILGDMINILGQLYQFAKKYNIAILVTSQITAALNSGYFFDIIPLLGTTLNIYIKNWILLGESEEITAFSENAGKRYAHLINGYKKEGIAKFIIKTEGIQDYFT